MFASECRKDVAVGDDVVTVRKLSARSLEKAREARSSAQLQTLRAMGGDVVKAMRSEDVETLARKLNSLKDDPEAVRRQRYEEFDRDQVLTAGIVRWTAERELNPDAIGDLDEETAQILHEAILDLSLPPLAVEAEVADAKG